MILYHGSFLEIAKPDLVHSRPNVDFGRGFYVIPLYEQAAKWCGKFKHRGKDGIISRYEYDESREAELKNRSKVQIQMLNPIVLCHLSGCLYLLLVFLSVRN